MGIGTSRLIAKVSSGKAKPNGVLWIVPGQEAKFLAPLDVREIPGVGKRPILAIPAAFVRRMDETEQESSARSERRHALPKGSVAR